jgi:hypothetical protein
VVESSLKPASSESSIGKGDKMTKEARLDFELTRVKNEDDRDTKERGRK